MPQHSTGSRTTCLDIKNENRQKRLSRTLAVIELSCFSSANRNSSPVIKSKQSDLELMSRAAAILAGGESRRLRNKALIPLAGKPMILHIMEKCRDIVDEILIVVNSRSQLDAVRRVAGTVARCRVVVDDQRSPQTPLLGAHTAFENSPSVLTLLLPCDTPLIKTGVLEMLFLLIDGWDAIVPRHPSGHIEPLHAVYRTDVSRGIANDLISLGNKSMRDFIVKLRTLYLSTESLKQVDPRLESFENVNTPSQLRTIQKKLS